MRFRRLPLTDPGVLATLMSRNAIMLHKDDRQTFRGRGGHYKARLDAQGWHIRVGKRGTVKCYLTVCDAVFFNESEGGGSPLYQFRTKRFADADEV